MGEAYILRGVRTQELKAKRRIYGGTGGHLHFREQVLMPRMDGASNTISTFDKDNYVLVEQLPLH